MSKATNLKRRDFLVSVGLGGAGAAAAVVAGKAAMKTKAGSKPEDGAPGKGYQLSEHVRNYYRTTRV